MQSALERTGTAIYVMDNNSNYVDREEIIGFDALYDSMMKSKKGVTWKGSVAHYVLNSMEEPCEQRKFLSPYTPHGQILQEFME